MLFSRRPRFVVTQRAFRGSRGDIGRPPHPRTYVPPKYSVAACVRGGAIYWARPIGVIPNRKAIARIPPNTSCAS